MALVEASVGAAGKLLAKTLLVHVMTIVEASVGAAGKLLAKTLLVMS